MCDVNVDGSLRSFTLAADAYGGLSAAKPLEGVGEWAWRYCGGYARRRTVGAPS